ncbi:ATP-dependent helicase HrpB [Sphingobium sufflavum]|uniref:ATP-dependent helicase HrpB n=1 Tax=Sphingobium sufflavum TaxID=1129547 RepID=UPI001F17C092|nr:ATP-dependent helicase HrpB [Sphingobium sufflavum]MCE7798502.1 ATP-dependent helicase HrpB [Sphingobium sufflavum]
MTPMSLPIDAVLPDLLAVLRAAPNAVLVAPPGAGKTTRVATALLDQPWCTGQVWLLSPRRLAARAAAERMAEMAGEKAGETVGYITRLDSKVSAKTRVLVVTQGVFLRRIQDDPALDGVSAVLFDEVHERSLDGDFGLALALDAQGGLRDDLRLVAMSATLDGTRFSTLMGNASVVESEGRSHPVAYRHIGRVATQRIEDSVAAAVVRALAEEPAGDILAFLPGVGEIERTAERLAGRAEAFALHRLHGSLEPAQQRVALRPSADGRRKVILATSIAETSLTIDGVRIVIDSGLSRRPTHDVAAGVTRLVTQRVSNAAAIQRAGRAGRQAPGIAYRLWEAAATGGLPPYDTPEILSSDLSSLLLDCAIWGVTDPAGLPWLDAPPVAALTEAGRRLQGIGALDGEGRATAHGRTVAALPLDPRLAHMLVVAGERGMAGVAAEVAALLTERGLGGSDIDVATRRERWRREKGARADAARSLARRWAKLAGGRDGEEGDDAVALCLSLAFPDRVAKRRGADGADWISAGGRAFRLDPLSPLARAEWLAIGEVQGTAAGARILSAAPIDARRIETLFADRIADHRTVRFKPEIGGVEALRERRLGAIRLSSGNDDAPDRDAVVAALAAGIAAQGLEDLPWPDGARSLRMRASYAGEESIGEAALRESVAAWLPEVLPAGARRLSAINPGALSQMLDNRLGWDGQKRVERIAPRQFVSPAGSHHDIDYGAEGGPRVELRVQALFGVAEHPLVGEARVPLVLSLTSPAGRPIQTTRDLPAFWRGSWADVAKEMRGRYPRHPWPDDPMAASATLRTKNADARRKG